MWTQTSSGAAYDDPALGTGECGNYCSSVVPAEAERRAIHDRSEQYGLYFRDPADNVSFTVHTEADDSYDGYLTAETASGMSLVSGIRKATLLTKDGVPIQDDLSLSGSNITLSTQYLIDNLQNSQNTYILRLYDNTAGR